MVEPLDPLPLEDVLDIVDRRRRHRERAVLRSAVGAGVVVAAVVGIRVGSGGDGSPTTTVAPAGTGPASTTTTAATPGVALPEPWHDAALERFLGSAFDAADAVRLAELWQVEDRVARVVLGEALRNGDPPGVEALAADGAPAGDAEAVQAELLGAFFDAHLVYADAAELAELWGVEAYEAKLLAGVRLTAGEEVRG